MPKIKESKEGKLLMQLARYHIINVKGKNVPMSKYLWHNANGGIRNVLEAVSLKLQGTKAGVSDYTFALPSGPYHGAFVELKRRENRATVTADQINFIYDMREVGYFADVAYGADEAFKMLVTYLENPIDIKFRA